MNLQMNDVMTIDILLSVYGNAPYLVPFLASLKAQKGTRFRLLYRFDGSPGAEAEAELKRFGGTEVPGGERCGVVHSYQRLLRASDADYLMFADQDDVWHDDKIARSLTAMLTAEKEAADIPLLVHSDLRVVDEKLQLVHPSMRKYQALEPQRNRLRDLMIQNNVTGCTALFNRKLADLVSFPQEDVICHDWYLALTAAAFGKIIYLDEPLLDYRQHADNVYGAVSRSRIFSRGVSRQPLHERIVRTQKQAGAFCRQFRSRLRPEEIEMLEAWQRNSSEPIYWKRLFSAWRHGFRKNDLLRTFGMWWAL